MTASRRSAAHSFAERNPGRKSGFHFSWDCFDFGADSELARARSEKWEPLFGQIERQTRTGTRTSYVHPDAVQVGPDVTFLHRDHSQSIRLRTDAAGSPTQAALYTPYGVQQLSPPEPGLTISKGYIGEKHDPETGLLYLNARYMDPVLARFISPDDWLPTISGVGTNISDMHMLITIPSIKTIPTFRHVNHSLKTLQCFLS